MAFLQVISENDDFRKSIKKRYNLEYKTFISKNMNDGIKNTILNPIDILIIDLNTENAFDGKWLKKVIDKKDIFSAELSILLLVSKEKLNQLNSMFKQQTFIQDIFFYENQLNWNIIEKEIEFFIKKNLYFLEIKRKNFLLDFENQSINQSYLKQNQYSKQKNSFIEPHTFLQGQSKKSLQLQLEISKAIDSQNITLLMGDKGLEQEKIAFHLHQKIYNKKNKPHFISVDLKNLPSYLQSIRLFGSNEQNLFETNNKTNGIFEYAKNGTIFIDSIEYFTWDTQTKLLNYIQKNNNKIKLILSTNKNLEILVDQGLFRQDLYSKMQMSSIKIPNLQERKEDIPLFAESLVKWHNNIYQSNLELSTNFKYDIMDSKYASNVDELFSLLHILFSLTDKPKITSSLLNLTYYKRDPQTRIENKYNDQLSNHKFLKEDKTSNLKQSLLFTNNSPLIHKLQRQNIHQKKPEKNNEVNIIIDKNNLNLSLAQVEQYYIEQTLNKNNNNISVSARILQISRKTLYDKIKKYKIILNDENKKHNTKRIS